MENETPTEVIIALEVLLRKLDDPDFSSEINNKDVESALLRIKNKVFNSRDLFVVLCSLNLLNAAIKRKDFKKSLNYRDIKGNATRILSYLVSLRDQKFDIEFCINEEERCAYLEIYSVQFSFHQIPINAAVSQFIKSDRNKVVPWKGKRLQRVAGDLFRYAITLEEKNI